VGVDAVHCEGCATAVAGVEVFEVTLERLLFGKFALATVRVLLDAADNRVDSDQDGEDSGQAALHHDENDTSDGLGGLGDVELLDED
jgi:hypothetical protein